MFLPCATACPSFTRHAAGAAALGELEAEPALARSRLGHDADDLAVAGLRLLQRRLQRRHVGVAADEAREAAAPRDVEARARRADADAGGGRWTGARTPFTWNSPRSSSSK